MNALNSSGISEIIPIESGRSGKGEARGIEILSGRARRSFDWGRLTHLLPIEDDIGGRTFHVRSISVTLFPPCVVSRPERKCRGVRGFVSSGCPYAELFPNRYTLSKTGETLFLLNSLPAGELNSGRLRSYYRSISIDTILDRQRAAHAVFADIFNALTAKPTGYGTLQVQSVQDRRFLDSGRDCPRE